MHFTFRRCICQFSDHGPICCQHFLQHRTPIRRRIAPNCCTCTGCSINTHYGLRSQYTCSFRGILGMQVFNYSLKANLKVFFVGKCISFFASSHSGSTRNCGRHFGSFPAGNSRSGVATIVAGRGKFRNGSEDMGLPLHKKVSCSNAISFVCNALFLFAGKRVRTKTIILLGQCLRDPR